jgi:type I restriction enzyme S subunit
MKQNNNIPQGYKNSPLGIIPKEWEVKKLGKVFTQLGNFSFSRDQMTNEPQELRYIHYGDIHVNIEQDNVDLTKGELPFIFDGLISDEKLKDEQFPYLQNGDVILADASEDYEGVGKSWEIIETDNQKIISGLHTIPLRCQTNEIAVGFGRYLFKNPKSAIALKKIAQGTKVYSISYKHISNLDILIPPLPEQQKIAEILSVWDRAIDAQTQLIASLQTRKRALMQQLLTGKKRLKGFTKKWETIELGDLLDYEQPTPYLVKSTEYNNKYTTPVLTAGKTFILGYTDEVKGVFENNLPVIIFDDFTTDTKFVDFPFKAKSSAMKILLTKENVNIKYVYEAMQMIKYAIGGHERHWISKFSYLTIQVPPLPEQTAIAEILSAADKEISFAQEKLAKMKSQKKGLMQVLLTGKRRVEKRNKKENK